MSKYTKHDVNKAYISPIDKFLFSFDATHAKSPSQLKEIKKYQKIFTLRDHKKEEIGKEEIWKEF